MAKILLVEDNPIVVKALLEPLREQQHDVEVAHTGSMAKEMIEKHQYDLILLDLILPEMSGVDLLRMIRQFSDVPVIIVSSKNSAYDKSLHLELGADDYISKPIFPMELTARINAVLRRTNKKKKPMLMSHRNLTIDVLKKQVMRNHEPLSLTSKEFQILLLLLENQGDIVSKREIYVKVWGEQYFDSDNTINVHIKRLRDKIEEDSKNPEIIHTVWGYGYKIDIDGQCKE